MDIQNKSKTAAYIAECSRCQSNEPKEYFFYEPNEDWIVVFPKKRLIHLHYGTVSYKENSTTEEAQWIVDTYTSIGSNYPSVQFCSVVDFSISINNNSEFVTPASLQLYKQLVKLEHISLFIGYGISPAFRMLINLLKISLRTTAKKITVVISAEDAENKYKDWSKKEV